MFTCDSDSRDGVVRGHDQTFPSPHFVVVVVVHKPAANSPSSPFLSIPISASSSPLTKAAHGRGDFDFSSPSGPPPPPPGLYG
jgi:hypothetical protein